jgi:hypothetical protein
MYLPCLITKQIKKEKENNMFLLFRIDRKYASDIIFMGGFVRESDGFQKKA